MVRIKFMGQYGRPNLALAGLLVQAGCTSWYPAK